MELIEFTDEYKTGITTIDYEHQKLVNYLNDIINASKMGDEGRLLIEINLDELISYTVFHFRNEEELMEKFNFDGFEAHKKGHESLRQRLMMFKERFNSGESITTELLDFLKDWLFKHIKGTDRQYIETFKKNGVL